MVEIYSNSFLGNFEEMDMIEEDLAMSTWVKLFEKQERFKHN